MTKTDKALLQKSLALTKKVKAFGATTGIPPTKTLSKIADEKIIRCFARFYVQQRNTIGTRPDIIVDGIFNLAQDQLMPRGTWCTNTHSVYYRPIAVFALSSMPALISSAFARTSTRRQTETILHEDLHFIIPGNESLVTPVGCLAGLAFFQHQGDKTRTAQMEHFIKQTRIVSQELNHCVEELKRMFFANLFASRQKSIHEKALRIIKHYPHFYKRRFRRAIWGQNEKIFLEAKISHDLMYYRCFDRVVSLSEKIGDIKTLIAELKQAPPDEEGIDAYLDELEKKYERPTFQ